MSIHPLNTKQLAGVLRQYRHLLLDVDAWFDRCLDAGGADLACRSGCSFCCKALFDISLLDAWILREEFESLPEPVQDKVKARCLPRLKELQHRWPKLVSPFFLNNFPEEEWMEMPEDDQAPCPLLDENGKCMVYSSRPLICRLHGLPHIDSTGKDFSGVVCSLHNKAPESLLPKEVLRWHFRDAFETEVALMRAFVVELTGGRYRELDTFIPLSLLVDYTKVDWQRLEL